VLEKIKAGEIDLVFRRWQKPTVKTGGSLTTHIGVLDILSVEIVEPAQISDEDAKRAGFADQTALMDQWESRSGVWFKINVRFAGDDPRIKLREEDTFSDQDFSTISKKLFGMDTRSTCGPWTMKVLTAIRTSPKVISTTLANELGFERMWFKANVRKLKALGLTISHKPGYVLSPRGEAVLQRLQLEK